MLNKIINTIGSQLIISIISLTLSIIYAQTLGKDGVAEIAIIVLGISIISMINTLLGSTSIIYLGSRVNVFSILILSYSWILFFSIIITPILYLTNLIPANFAIHIGLIAFFESLTSTNNQILLSRNKIKSYNLVRIIQKGLLLIGITTLFFFFNLHDIEYFVWAYLISVFCVFIFSFILIINFIENLKTSNLKALFIKKLTYGSQLQFSMFFTLITNRLSYYLLENFWGKSLGIFAQGVQLMENNLIIAKSISLVQVSSIANKNNNENPEKLTLTLFKLTGFITLSLVVIMMIIPESVYTFVFSKDFIGVKKVIYIYAPTIFLMAVSSIFTHYFCGIAKYYYTTLVSFVGLVINFLFSFYLIPKYGIMGAGISLIATNLAILLILMHQFIKNTSVTYLDLVPTKKDFTNLIGLIKGKLGTN